MEQLIKADNLGKKYERRLGRPGAKTLREAVYDIFLPDNQKQDASFWALKHVSFSISRGDVVGVVGQNGAGKTTLFSLLSRITVPTEGSFSLNGRVGSLLGANTAFHPELTGRENIFLTAAIMGMSMKRAEDQFNEIVDFAEIEAFLDTPIKHFSSGMLMRLGFSIAVHLLPEILILDEVLAVGDLAFQQKALQKTKAISSDERAILFVSHSLDTVRAICNKCIVLHEGHMHYFGDVATGIDTYMKILNQGAAEQISARSDRRGDGRFRVQDINLSSPGSDITTHQPFRCEVIYASDQNTSCELSLTLIISDIFGGSLLRLSNVLVGENFATAPHQGCFICELPQLPLAPGTYDINIRLTADNALSDEVMMAKRFQVHAKDDMKELMLVEHKGVLIEQHWMLKSG